MNNDNLPVMDEVQSEVISQTPRPPLVLIPHLEVQRLMDVMCTALEQQG